MTQINLSNVCFIAAFIVLSITGCNSNDLPYEITSPDGSISFELCDDLMYSVKNREALVIGASKLGFETTDGVDLFDDLEVARVKKQSINTTWEPLYGEKNIYTDQYNEAVISFKDIDESLNGASLRVRVYNEGVAFQYEFDSKEEIKITKELTQFNFTTDPTVWVSSKAQSAINKVKLSDLPYVAERPLLAELNNHTYLALGEANLVDFARMKFKKNDSCTNGLVASLETTPSDSRKDKKKYDVFFPKGIYKTPWRYVMVGNSPVELLSNNHFILNLNEPNKIANPAFIKPGKVIREVTLTTIGGKACVDFAVKHNLQFIEFDAGWYGNEYDEASDATTITVDPNRSPGPLDLHEVVAYAKSKGIGVILYINRRAMEKQLDEFLPLAKSWGIAGLKYGFVQVGPQKWTTWLHDAVRKAAANDLMVDIHDEYRPTGYSRTFPNLMTQEGIRGDEESTPNDMVINTIFTRMIAGAGDQTNCYFADRVRDNMGSNASQMAKAICIYSPWQFLYWYDRPVGSPIEKGGAGDDAVLPIPEIEDLTFYDQLPTVWDDTKVIDGYPGELAMIARKKEDAWFLGVITGNKTHAEPIGLDFLDDGRKYKATIYSHDDSLETLTQIKIKHIEVTSTDVISEKILEQNGLAVIFKPFE